MTDWGALYRHNLDAVCTLIEGLDDVQLATRVPGSPHWSVREVVQHLAGGPADALAGRMEGAPGAEWTARHVAARSETPLADLLAEMRANADAVAASVADNPRPALVWDIAVHHADLNEALARPCTPERFWAPIVEALGPVMAPDLAGRISDYELFRALFSRRSVAQMLAWGTGLDADRLSGLGIFGPRTDDQPVPR